MIAEYISSGTHDCPLIKLYDYSYNELASLCEVLGKLGRLEQASVDFAQLDFASISGMNSFRLIVGGRPCVSDYEGRFTWGNRSEDWLAVIKMLEPLLSTDTNAGYHQWLAGREASEPFDRTDIAVVITDSREGAW